MDSLLKLRSCKDAGGSLRRKYQTIKTEFINRWNVVFDGFKGWEGGQPSGKNLQDAMRLVREKVHDHAEHNRMRDAKTREKARSLKKAGQQDEPVEEISSPATRGPLLSEKRPFDPGTVALACCNMLRV